ncbi:chitin binding protein [Penicillium angulare]|uniref:chitin binding protein n=1 Tax=Penicillium angulare TaxID=116970 RepID=UPI00253F7D79|nr:chitin binding protein [Penicillium angulare]KAJ5291997.1 chitin binding protein [Penicillium angulare]
MKQSTSFSAASALFALIPLVHGHGFVSSPTPRYPGSAFEAACGQQAYDTETSDIYGNIQSELQVASTQSDYNAASCDAWLCKGFKYADNNVTYSYKAGETVDFDVTIHAPHTGIANVSVVETSSNTVIGDPLIYWSVYASVSTTIPANNTQFSVTIPDDLGGKCATGGECVLQWYWYAESIDQTYESCVDFTVDGSGSDSSSDSSSGSSSSSSVTSSIAIETSSSVSSETSAPAEITPPAATSTSAPVEASVPAETSTTAETSSATADVVATTTFATRARESATPSADPSSVASSVPIPVNGTAEEKLSWIESVMKYLVNGN